jgi:hypothetical protein
VARTGSPDPTGDTRNAILERQFGLCSGQGCEANISTTAIVQHTLPRALGGTDAPSNLELMCGDCAGMKSRTIGFPAHLMNQSQRWLEDQADVRSFTHLLRLALTEYITHDDVIVDPRAHEKVLREMAEMTERMERTLSLKKEAEDAVVKLTRAYGYDVVKRSYIHQMKSVKEEEKRHQRLHRG